MFLFEDPVLLFLFWSKDPFPFFFVKTFQIDLATQKPVTGIMVQGGYYEDLTGILFNRQETWIPEFAVSYAEREGRPFKYILYDGDVQVLSFICSEIIFKDSLIISA